MAVKVVPLKLLLSKCYVLSCLCVRVYFVCPFAHDYIDVGLWAFDLLKIGNISMLFLLLLL
jgi:hypothetical protein